MHILDEFMGHPDTETLAKAINAKYRDKAGKIIVYPDPSGRSRKTSAAVGVTDFSILSKAGLITLAHKKAPPIIDSVNAVNKKLENASGDLDLFVSPNAPNVIKSLERTSWVENNPDTATINKKEGVEHFSDGIRYAVEYLWPVQHRVVSSKRSTGF